LFDAATATFGPGQGSVSLKRRTIMGSIAVTTGTVRVRDCPEVKSILKALDELAEGMDERRVESRKVVRRKYGRGVPEAARQSLDGRGGGGARRTRHGRRHR